MEIRQERLNGLRRMLVLLGLTLLILQVNAQEYDTLTGVVKDITTKKIISGAKVYTTDNSSISMTNDSGAFSLKSSLNKRSIIVVAPGYNMREVYVNRGLNNIMVNLYPESFSNFFNKSIVLQELTDKTTQISAINSSLLDNHNSISVENEIQKNPLANIRVIQHSGVQGTGATMFIRGYNSLNTNAQPLILIDGVVYENWNGWNSIFNGNLLNGLIGIDVNDIESINIIKDGTSIYGSKAGNGIIELQTKRGKDMVTRITASTMAGFNSEPPFMPMMNADQYRIYLSDFLDNGPNSSKISNQYFLNDDPNFLYYKQYHNSTNWKKLVYRNSLTQSYHVSANGGDEIALYNLSMGFTNAQSTIKENDMTRLNARFNSSVSLSDKLSTKFDISYAQVSRKLQNEGISELTGNTLIDAPGYLSLIKAPFLSPYQYSNDGKKSTKLENYDFIGIANPLAINQYGVGDETQSVFNLTIQPQFEFSRDWTLNSLFNYNFCSLSENYFRPMYGVAPYILFNTDIISLNQVKTQFVKQINLLSDTRLNWNKTFQEHTFKILAGLRFIQSGIKAEYASGHNTGSDEVKEMSGGLSYKSVGGKDDMYRDINYYACGTYNFNRKYLIDVALAFESNSRFGSQAKDGIRLFGVSWGTFPSVNAAWIISSEDFMKSMDFINILKLRAGYGLSGNDGIESTTSRSYLNAEKYYSNAVGLQINNIANPEIQWETVTKRNIGIDADLFDGKLNFGLDFYKNTTDNLIVLKSLKQVSGLKKYFCNDGKLDNLGVELNFNTKLITRVSFQMEAGASVALNKNRILSLPNGDYTTNIFDGEVLTAVNQPIGQFYGYQTQGVFSTAESASAANLSYRTSTGLLKPFEAGDVIFSDNHHDGVIDEKDKTVIGNSQPDYYGTIYLNTRYKHLKLDVLFNYVYGNEIYNYLRSQLESGSSYYNQTSAMLNRWRSEGQITEIPKSTFNDPKGNNRFSDRWIEDGSFIRLKNVQLSYEIPVNSMYIQGLSIWTSISNVFTFTKYLGVDPEFSNSNNVLYQGVDSGILPQSRSFNLGLIINL